MSKRIEQMVTMGQKNLQVPTGRGGDLSPAPCMRIYLIAAYGQTCWTRSFCIPRQKVAINHKPFTHTKIGKTTWTMETRPLEPLSRARLWSAHMHVAVVDCRSEVRCYLLTDFALQ